MRNALKLPLVLAFACLLAGCTTLRLAYDNADLYLHYRANSYLDLDARGAFELEERIEEFFAWHRKNALPQYASLSDEAAKRVSRGLTPEDVLWGYDTVMVQTQQSLRVGAERIAPMLDRLTPQQIAHLQKRFAEDNQRFARENLQASDAERRKRRAKRLEQRLQDWVGNLSPAQLEKVKQFSQRSPLYDELRDRDRRRMQAELVDMIRRREAHKRLPDWIADWEHGRDPQYRAAAARWREEYGALLVELDQTLTPAQRRRAEAQLRRYAQDFRILARNPD